MTKKEFEDRTGVQISDELFESINIIYMNAGDNIDKDTFCKDYKSTPTARFYTRFTTE